MDGSEHLAGAAGLVDHVDAERYRSLPPLPPTLTADVRRTPDGGAVVTLLTDPAAVDEMGFARPHRQWSDGTRR